tara:strand:- start:2391 stop:3170 length:780 start_codon:yes stop_codon:yes gene_type:complete
MTVNVGVIPVRMNSSRFPGKPLKKICNIPMLAHIYERVKISKKLDKIYIATCDNEISRYASTIGAECIMTKKTHKRASDRVEESIHKIEAIIGKRIKNIIMVQGDEPLVHPEMIDNTISFLNKKNVGVTNIVTEIEKISEWENENLIKVLCNKDNNAIYFSRQPIPFLDTFSKKYTLRQICIIGFTRKMIKKFQSLSESKLEILESIDMNRFIENNIPIKLIYTQQKPFPVDTYTDLKKVERLMKKDKLFENYRRKFNA